MTIEKKSQHILAIQQALAQFDIETQVKKMTLQTMNAYMLGNKQAFDYIKQWQKKFIQFQARLAKAQTYYRNIEMSVNSKIQVTNSLNSRLEKFAQQFYVAIKQSTQSLQQMRKNYINLVKQTGNQAGSIRGLQRQQKQLSTKISKLQDQLHNETNNLTQKILQTDQQLALKNKQRISDHEKLLIKFSESKSQIDSKSQTLNQLCKDMGLYMNEKLALQSQIRNIYQEINNRVLIAQYNKLRIYIDNQTCVNKVRIEEVNQQLRNKMQEQIEARIVGDRDILQKIEINKKQVDEKILQIEQVITKNKQQIISQVSDLQSKTETKLTNLQSQTTQNTTNITQSQKQLQILQNQLQTNINQLNQKLQLIKIQITQFQSNVSSINGLISNIEKDNLSREEELSKLKVDSDSRGDIGEQVKKLAEKVLGHDENIRKNQEKAFGVALKVQENQLNFNKNIQQLNKKISSQYTILQTTQKTDHKNLTQKLEQNSQTLSQQITQNNKQTITHFQNTITQQILSIRQKFQFLNNVSSDIEKFKKQFEQQLQMNDILNREVKQKMDRMFGLITKLKTDVFIKLEALMLENGKCMGKIKENCKILGEICAILGVYNQTIGVILCVEVWKQFSQEKQAMQQYKIASIIEGWVLELSKQKTKYRGEQTSRRALIQLCLQHHVKNGDKLKGNILENGKDVFNRMIGGNQQYQQLRKRSISRKKQRQSQLPKVYR